jgi:predicted PurR-regulated permease PerM
MIVTFVLLYAGLLILGLQYAFVFSVLSALFVVVPYFGSIAGGIPPVLFGFSESPTKGLLVLGVYLLTQQIEGNVIIPMVMSKTVKLHPAVVLVGVVLVGQVFGFIGLFVAIPILSAAIILVRVLWVGRMEPTT